VCTCVRVKVCTRARARACACSCCKCVRVRACACACARACLQINNGSMRVYEPEEFNECWGIYRSLLKRKSLSTRY